MAASCSHGVLEKDLMEERKGESFLKFEEAEGCREKSKEMGESGVTRIDDVSYLYPLD